MTLGYEKREVPEFIGILREHGVAAIADLRIRPYSRKKGFSKKALEAELVKNGIEYHHFVELGSPQPIRDQLHADWDFARFLRDYNRHLDTQAEPLARLHGLAISKPTCLLCFERDINQCHRKLVVERLVKLHPGDFEVVHIG